MTPTDLAARWQKIATVQGIEACVLQIRGDVFRASTDQEVTVLIGALRLLNSGLVLSTEESRRLKAILSSAAGDRLATEVVETEQLRDLRARRDELRVQYDHQVASSAALAKEQEVYQQLCVRRNLLERAIGDIKDRIRSLAEEEH